MKSLMLLGINLVTFFVCGISYAQETIPDIGIDMAGTILSFILGFGSIVLVILGGNFAFKVIWTSLKVSDAITHTMTDEEYMAENDLTEEQYYGYSRSDK